jgi:hypothetical protein
MIVGRRTERDDLAANASARGQTREAKLEAAAAAIGLILEEVGPFAALILLNASISAVEDRVRGFHRPLCLRQKGTPLSGSPT